jgi:TonB family protein
MMQLVVQMATLLAMMFVQASRTYIPLESAPTYPPPAHFSEVGFSVFDLKLNSDGTVAKDELLRGQAQFVDRSRLAFHDWRFMKAIHDDIHVNAIFLYKPQSNLPDSRFTLNLPPPETELQSPFPIKVVDPGFPLNGVSGGEVVLQVGLDSTGSVSNINVIQSAPTLTEAAVAAVHEWKFQIPSAADELSRTAVIVMYFDAPTTNAGEVGPTEPKEDQAIFVAGDAAPIPAGTSGTLLTGDPQSLTFRYGDSHWTLPYLWISQIQYADNLPEGDLVILTVSEPGQKPGTVTFRLTRKMALSAASSLSARSGTPVDFTRETRQSMSLGR